MRSCHIGSRSYVTLRGTELEYVTDYGRDHLTTFTTTEQDGRFVILDEHGKVMVDVPRKTARLLHVMTHDREPDAATK